MKHSFYIAIILLLIVIGFAFLIHISEHTIDRELYETEKAAMEDSLSKSKLREMALQKKDSIQAHQIDSLEKKQNELQAQTNAAKDSIDKILARDSTQALKQNRLALNQLGIQTASGPFLTNYEMGWNAKFLQENFGMRLQINICNEAKDSLKSNLRTKDAIISEKEKQLIATDSLKTIADKNAKTFEELYESTQSIFDDRFIFYGGWGIDSHGSLGFQGGIGIRLYTIKFGGL